MEKKNRDNERTIKYLKESQDRFLQFIEKCKSLSLGTRKYIFKSLDTFAEATGILEGILFFELVKDTIVENDITYEELACKIDEINRDVQLKPGEHVYKESHLRVTIKRRNYNSIVIKDLKEVLHINDKNIKQDFLRKGKNNLDYLRFAFISLDKVTQETFLSLADSLYYMEKHTQNISNDIEENDNGLVDTKRLQDAYRKELLMGEEEYKEYKEQEQYLDNLSD